MKDPRLIQSALANLETSVNELDAIARHAMANSEGELPHVASAHVRIWHTATVCIAANFPSRIGMKADQSQLKELSRTSHARTPVPVECRLFQIIAGVSIVTWA